MTDTDHHIKPAPAHTPGPWEVIPARGNMLPHLMGGDHCRIALLDDCHAAESEREANARLIAAAPDLLQALKIAEYWLLQRNAWHTLQFHDSKRKAADQIIATLAKATGRPV